MYCKNCKKKMKKTKGNHLYVESGLDNIMLKDIPIYECKCGKKIPIISHIDHLHKLIADLLTAKEEGLRGKEIKFIRKMMDLKAVDLARHLRVTKQTVSNWENDKTNISTAHDRLLRLFFHCPELLRFIEHSIAMPKPYLELDFPTFVHSMRSIESRIIESRMFESRKRIYENPAWNVEPNVHTALTVCGLARR